MTETTLLQLLVGILGGRVLHDVENQLHGVLVEAGLGVAVLRETFNHAGS